VETSTTIATLQEVAERDLGKAPRTIQHILLNGKPLKGEDSISSAGVPDASTLIFVCCDALDSAKKLFEEVFHVIKKKGPDAYGRPRVSDSADENCAFAPHSLQDADVPDQLQSVAETLGIKELPDDVATWMHVLMTCGVRILDGGFRFEPGVLCGKLPTFRAQLYPGLIYLSISGRDDDSWMHILDVAGELSRMHGKEGKGGIWFANVHCEVWQIADKLTVEFWQRLQNGEVTAGGYPLGVNVSPVCVAPNLDSFFEAWAATGEPPTYTFDEANKGKGKGKGKTRCSPYAPNRACDWLAAKAGKTVESEQSNETQVDSALEGAE